MAEMPYVCLYASYLESFEPFSDAELGRLVKAMLSYTISGTIPDFDGNERYIWPTIKAQIDRDKAAYGAKCNRNRANGAKGGRPVKNPEVIPETERLLEKPKKAKEKEKEKEKEKDIDYKQVVDLYHAICKSFPKIRSLSDARKKAIKARLKKYNQDDFRAVFENAENSSFLKGEDGGWKASFDWLIKEANMLKVLEGNYADKPRRGKTVPYGASGLGEAELEAIQKMFKE